MNPIAKIPMMTIFCDRPFFTDANEDFELAWAVTQAMKEEDFVSAPSVCTLAAQDMWGDL